MMNKKRLLSVFVFLSFLGQSHVAAEECKPREYKKINGKSIEIRTMCLSESYLKIEYVGGKQNGLQMSYFNSGKVRAISIFRNGLKEDSSLVYDSLGNLVAKRFYRRGKSVGVHTTWFSSGKIESIIHYNDKTERHGLDAEWYDETHPKHELHYAAGVCTLGVEYYRNGNKRLYYRHPAIPSKSIFKRKLSEGESWSWSGKSIAKVVKGNGTQITLPYDFDDPTEKKIGFYEEFKDSLAGKFVELDSAAVMKYK